MAIRSEDIKLVLGPVEPQHYFYAKDGTVVKSLVDLARTMELMDDSSFKHHIADGRNDFASWINDIIKDKKLANEIKPLKSRESMLQKIEERVNQLRRLERKLSEMETETKVITEKVQGLQGMRELQKRYDSGSIKEYMYGLVIGIIVGVLIGLLI